MPDIHGFRPRACPTRKLVAIDGHQFNPRRDKGFGRSTGLSPRVPTISSEPCRPELILLCAPSPSRRRAHFTRQSGAPTWSRTRVAPAGSPSRCNSAPRRRTRPAPDQLLRPVAPAARGDRPNRVRVWANGCRTSADPDGVGISMSVRNPSTRHLPTCGPSHIGGTYSGAGRPSKGCQVSRISVSKRIRAKAFRRWLDCHPEKGRFFNSLKRRCRLLRPDS